MLRGWLDWTVAMIRVHLPPWVVVMLAQLAPTCLLLLRAE